MSDLYIKNISGSQMTISRLGGCRLADNEAYELTRTRTWEDIYQCPTLVELINSDDLEVSKDGETWLSKTDGVFYVKRFQPTTPTECIAFESTTTNWNLTINDSGVVSTSEIT